MALLIDQQIQRAEIEKAKAKPPETLDVYDLSLRGVVKFNSGLKDNVEHVLLQLQALEIDPDYLPAMGRVSQALSRRLGWGWARLSNSERAMSLDYCWRVIGGATDAATLASCALTLIEVGHDYDAGLAVAARALASDPNNILTLMNVGSAEMMAGGLDRAMELFQRAMPAIGSGDDTAPWPLIGFVAQMV